MPSSLLRQPAREAAVVAVDFETTGSVKGYDVEPWQIGWIELRAGQLRPESAYSSLLRVGARPFNPAAPGRHAVWRADIAAAPLPGELWPDLERRLVGRPLAAHAAGTERKFLRRIAPLTRWGPWIDTLALTRQAFPGLRSYALEDALAALGLTADVHRLCPGLGPHDALWDAAGCAALLAHLLKQPGWQDLSVDALAHLSRGQTGAR